MGTSRQPFSFHFRQNATKLQAVKNGFQSRQGAGQLIWWWGRLMPAFWFVPETGLRGDFATWRNPWVPQGHWVGEYFNTLSLLFLQERLSNLRRPWTTWETDGSACWLIYIVRFSITCCTITESLRALPPHTVCLSIKEEKTRLVGQTVPASPTISGCLIWAKKSPKKTQKNKKTIKKPPKNHHHHQQILHEVRKIM